MLLVSYMPTATDFSCVQPFSACGSSHFSAGPWQPSQCTPSLMSNFGPRSSGLTSTAWQTRHLLLVSALACLSFWNQTTFSFSLGKSALGLVLPWQLDAPHEAAPVYL